MKLIAFICVLLLCACAEEVDFVKTNNRNYYFITEVKQIYNKPKGHCICEFRQLMKPTAYRDELTRDILWVPCPCSTRIGDSVVLQIISKDSI